MGTRPEASEQQTARPDLLLVRVLKATSWGLAASLWHYWELAVTLTSLRWEDGSLEVCLWSPH